MSARLRNWGLVLLAYWGHLCLVPDVCVPQKARVLGLRAGAMLGTRRITSSKSRPGDPKSILGLWELYLHIFTQTQMPNWLA